MSDPSCAGEAIREAPAEAPILEASLPERAVIDAWANYWEAEFFVRYPEYAALYRRIGRDEMLKGVCATTMLADMDAAGVDKVVLSATCSNASVARLRQRYPDRFIACATMDPNRGMEGVRELGVLVRDEGFQALKFSPYLYGEPPNHAIYFPYYAKCVELGIPVLILTGHAAIARKSSFGLPLHLDDVALYFPELVIVAGHMGWPWTQELIALAWKHPNLYIDTSGHLPKHFPAELIRFIGKFGSTKVLFGTGYPFMSYALAVAQARGLAVGADSLQLFLHDNAARIWGLCRGAGA